MEKLFDYPALFWYNVIFSFLFCTGAGAFIQCWFLINFCAIKTRKRDYALYILISYLTSLLSFTFEMPTGFLFNTLLGITILIIFTNKILRQNYILATIAAALTIAVTVLVESGSLSFYYLCLYEFSVPQPVSLTVTSVLILVVSFFAYKFFVDRYSIRSPYMAKYLLAFTLPILFIALALRTINDIKYAMTSDGLLSQTDKLQNYELLILTAIAFLCICAVLFSYEKTLKQIASEQEKKLLEAEILLQKNYVEEAKKKFATTKAFRHDFKSHIIALRGLIKQNELNKTIAYINRFEEIYSRISFLATTGNTVVDVLLSEKLSYARTLAIEVKCDVTIPQSVNIEDFDLCVIFANAIDNAVKACAALTSDDKYIDIAAKQHKSFFIIDIINNYQQGAVPKGSGIGLSAIKLIVGKYHGTVEISDENNIFRLSILLPFERS